MLDDEDMSDLQSFLSGANLLEELHLDYNSGLAKFDKIQLVAFFSALPKNLTVLNLEGCWLKKGIVLQALKESDLKPESLTICLDGEKLHITKKAAPSPKKSPYLEKSHGEKGEDGTSLKPLSGSTVPSRKSPELSISAGGTSALFGRRSVSEKPSSAPHPDFAGQQKSKHFEPKSKEAIHGRRAVKGQPKVRKDSEGQLSQSPNRKSEERIQQGRRTGTLRRRLFSPADKTSDTPEPDKTPKQEGPA